MRAGWYFLAAAAAAWPTTSSAQENAALSAAKQAYEALDYETAIAQAQRALGSRLSTIERIEAYELLGFTYAALDSTRLAVDAFREMIFLAPDREFDPDVVSPRITSLYASALGQVLVIRNVRVDSTSFVAGNGRVPLQFDVSRPAEVVIRAVGEGSDMRVDSLSVAALGGVFWRATDEAGDPVPPGRYQLVIQASAGRDEYASQIVVQVRHGAVDTLPHVTSLEGYAVRDSLQYPGRNWRPLGMAALYTAVASAASLALENSGLGSPPRKEIGGVSGIALLTGLIMSIKKPDPRPVPASIEFNRLLRDQIAQRNAEIARENDVRRSQVQLTVVPVRGGRQ
jgi:tetratricopeptide (TPR) repeat protein